MAQVSQYEKYWLLLLANGKLTIQVPTHMVESIKKAIIKRKYEHRLRTNIKFNWLKCLKEKAVDASGRELVGQTRITFKLHNLTGKDI